MPLLSFCSLQSLPSLQLLPMVSVFKAVKENNVEIVKCLIGMATGTFHASPLISKEDQQWLRSHMKAVGKKHYNLNKRSYRGRTALHLAAAMNRKKIAQLLIECPIVNINLQDEENGWTPLHKALYLGNIEVAILLLNRSDCDINLKDWEGMEAFELFSKTIKDAYPTYRLLGQPSAQEIEDHSLDPVLTSQRIPSSPKTGGTDLYTWGVNTNYILGLPDSDNRARPERVHLNLESQKTLQWIGRPSYLIQSVHMSKYHMAVLTSEETNNLLLCGFGRGGRLGTGKIADTQLSLLPMQWSEPISSVALGKDHTIAITKSGNVISFGSNRYGQLGYEVEAVKDESPMQLWPRKVQAAALKRQPIIGATASNVHSVVYTRNEVYTFGYNQGQLGYPCFSDDACQMMPKRVGFGEEVVSQVVATEHATAILLQSHNVILLCNYGQQRLIFPMHRFPLDRQVSSPVRSSIIRILGSGGCFMGAITSTGDVFLWTCQSNAGAKRQNEASEMGPRQKSKQNAAVSVSVPKRVWIANKAHLEAQQASIGQDGEVILSTRSGEVFIGTPMSSNKGSDYKFSKVPSLQRCVGVCASPSGAFAAIRSEYEIKKDNINRPFLVKDLVSSLPHKVIEPLLEDQIQCFIQQKEKITRELDTQEKEEKKKKGEIQETRQQVEAQCNLRVNKAIAEAWKEVEVLAEKDETLDIVFVFQQQQRLHLHNTFLSGRIRSFNQRVCGHPKHPQLTLRKNERLTEIHIPTVHLESFLLFVDYLYTDNYHHPMSTLYVPPVLCRGSQQPSLKSSVLQKDLVELASLFDLPILLQSAQSSFSSIPYPTLLTDMEYLFAEEANKNVQLNMRDGVLLCHEIIVRQRCPFFEGLFAPGYSWTEERRLSSNSQYIPVDLSHVSIDIMTPVLRYIYTDQDEVRLFGEIERNTAKEMIDFLLNVLSVADELLLLTLKSLCESSLVDFISLRTASFLLEQADVYMASTLKKACLMFIGANLPIFITPHQLYKTRLQGNEAATHERSDSMLNHLDKGLIADLETYVHDCQAVQMPFSRQEVFKKSLSLDLSDEEIEFSTSLYAMSLEDIPVTSHQIETLVTLHPPKKTAAEIQVVSGVQGAKSRKPHTNVSPQKETKKRGIRLDLGLVENTSSSQTGHPANVPAVFSRQGWGSPHSLASIEHSRPSLREILEQAPSKIEALTNAPVAAAKAILPPSIKKTSQKERRKQQQQETTTATATAAFSSSKPVWGKVVAEASEPNTFSLKTERISNPLIDKGFIGLEECKDKKVYIDKGSIKEKSFTQRPTAEITLSGPLFDPKRSLGDSFVCAPIRRRHHATGQLLPPSEGSKEKQSFEAILKQQILEERQLKGKKPKKSLVRIQAEERAIESLHDYYVQVVDINSGEWFEINRLES
ncbi:hypothetical protein BDF14DRAFT_1786675 [Spinellus fusiger]|nr:hypothetical protein BDF14DRAFT_1786675 [Spinellus fusiger]